MGCQENNTIFFKRSIKDMDTKELEKILGHLICLPKETEWVEFKTAANGFDSNKLGKYFSALSNEANLNGEPCGWLIFGIEDQNRKIVGSNYRKSPSSLEDLKHEIACKTNGRITFKGIYTLQHPQGRVILFEIPAASPGIPTAWEGHYYGREGESLGPLTLNEIERIRSQRLSEDWSAAILPNASLQDLDEQAIEFARSQFQQKNPRIADDIAQWNIIKFLDNARITIQGTITNTAILLLGKPQSAPLISPAQARITWMLHDNSGIVADYEHFDPPFILNAGKIFGKIRNLNYRYMKNDSLFPTEITQYDSWVIREALHNCIAHQDYTLQGRIQIIEKPECLIFSNVGGFLPGSVEAVIVKDRPQELYRNPFLSQAMVNLNMIDTVGSGIRKMYETQRNRYFPLPDFDLSDPQRVEVCIPGKILDENYTRLLIEKTELELPTVILLDKVQKKKQLTKQQHQMLKARHLVEGRYPNLYVSAHIAAVSGNKAKYIRNRGFDDRYYQDLILELITKHGSATRTDIDDLLMDKLPDVLDQQKKKTKIGNLLSKLRMEGRIQNTPGKRSNWILTGH